MNQKLRTARSGIVILFAVLCIVCLSLSLALSAHFAAYAEEGDNQLAPIDKEGRGLWQYNYVKDVDGEQVAQWEWQDLWNGTRNGKPISFIDTSQEGGIGHGGDEENQFAPYCGVELTIKLNPAYKIGEQTLDELYNLDAAIYEYNTAIGGADTAASMTYTKVTVAAKSQDTPSLILSKEWTIVPLFNDLVNAPETYIQNRGYGEVANYDLLRPVLGDTIIYHIAETTDEYNPVTISLIAVIFRDNGQDYKIAGQNESGYYVTDSPYVAEHEVENGKIINNIITNLRIGSYTLTVATVPFEKDNICYVQTSKSYRFNVVNLSIEGENFNKYFEYSISDRDRDIEFTEENDWIPNINLKFKEEGAPQLVQGVDYEVKAETVKVGRVDLVVVGLGNIVDSYKLEKVVNIMPAANEWKKDAMPGIITWVYGTYKPENNLIIGRPKYLDNISDITFQIVSLVADGDTVTEVEIEGLSDIHYKFDPVTNDTKWIVTDDVVELLSTLDVGNYRLYASVYGVKTTDIEWNRNYQPIEKTSVDFTIFQGINNWKAGAEPSIKAWTTGKLASTDGLINAESVHGEPILMIYAIGENGAKDTLIYSNLPDHANTEYGDINVLKGLKAGRYYLSAEVKGTDNYTGLKTTVLFDVTPNNLPVWAVILIVVGSLGTVAIVFVILHQKGILQMLTGKVIISMRTRANVDATLAAIRAAKVAREAEASIAAAKAREAEEAAKAEKSENK